MNYRHAYHAGSHTDVFKHAVLVMLLEHLRKKPKPFTVLDTHSGAGRYDLTAIEAEKTGEAADGVGRVIDKDVPAAAAYLDLIRRLNPDGLRIYPGSPAIIAAFLRDADRLIACELHEEEVAKLRRNFRSDSRVAVHHRDGYEAINAFVPLPARRGLVFIDPPYEKDDREAYRRVAERLNAGLKKWPTGMFAAWYPLEGPDRDRPDSRRLWPGRPTDAGRRVPPRAGRWRDVCGQRASHRQPALRDRGAAQGARARSCLRPSTRPRAG